MVHPRLQAPALVAAALCFLGSVRSSRAAETSASQPIVGTAAGFAVSVPLESAGLAPLAPAFQNHARTWEMLDREFRHEIRIKPPRSGFDTALQAPLLSLVTMPSPSLSFDGLSTGNNLAQYGFKVIPPDPNGDVGPNHYVQSVNLLIQVYSKSTGMPLLSTPVKMSSLFASIGGPCAIRNDGDPIVLYDPLANRWLLSQLGLSGPPFHQCVAVSKTGNPTGAYYAYDFVLPNNDLNDYSKFGVWPDAYYMTDNQFTSFTGPFDGAGVYAFDRAKMLAGDPTAGFIYFNLHVLDPSIGGVLPADLDGPPPPDGTPNYFAYFTARAFGDAQDGLRIFEFHPDFVTPANSTFTERPESPVATAAFDPILNCGVSGDDCIPQPFPATSTSRLDGISDQLMYRLQYRNFGDHESLVTTHTVDVDGTGHAGVRYYELRRPLPSGSFFVNEQATFAPDANHRWMGSAAMDRQGNLAVGYSVSSTTTFPSIRYAGRLATDPAGGLFQGEATLKAGSGSQTASNSRWGDYSMLAVDPADDCTFWYTNEYYAASGTNNWQTRIGKFKFPACTPAPAGTVTATATRTITAAPSNTPSGPTATPTSSPIPTSTPTITLTPTITSTPTPTVTSSVVTFPAVQDAWIEQDLPAQNRGNDTLLHVRAASGQVRRALVQFDLSSIPPSACVQSAVLRLTIGSVQSPVSRTYAVYRLTKSWTEGNGLNNSGVTWARRDGVNAWSAPGGDFASTATASTTTGISANTVLKWNVTADVAAYVSGSASNNGWLVKDTFESILFFSADFGLASRENATLSKRPQLVVTLGCP